MGRKSSHKLEHQELITDFILDIRRVLLVEMELLLETLYFVLPLLIAGIIHHFLIIKFNLFNFLVIPIDFGHKFKGERILGKSKTVRGILVVVIISGLVMWLLSTYFQIPLKISPFASGGILGLGYSLGELPNSFLKRRLKIAEGTTPNSILGVITYAVDQIDSIIGTILALYLIYTPTLFLVLMLFITGTLLHALIDALLYIFGYKRNLIKR